jgi:hypothetical protein
MIDPDTMGQPGKKVKVPTLLIWGGEDRFLNISMAHQSAKYLKNKTKKLSNHFLFMSFERLGTPFYVCVCVSIRAS